MIRKWFICNHDFKRIGRQVVGSTLERYIKCTKCQKTIVIRGLQKKYISEYDDFYEQSYIEMKTLKLRKKRRQIQYIRKILKILEK